MRLQNQTDGLATPGRPIDAFGASPEKSKKASSFLPSIMPPVANNDPDDPGTLKKKKGIPKIYDLTE